VYQHCLFCSSDLGRNEAVEAFQAGRCLAFDQARGRLWVVCPSCCRWNLSPLEERWEAIEECEAAFRGALLRKSTENIGLARMGDGTDLIRIGSPLLPELAVWRYQTRLTRRYRTHRRFAGAGSVAWAGYHTLYFTGTLTASTLALAGSLAFAGVATAVVGAEWLIRRRALGGRTTRVVLPDRGLNLRVRNADVGVMRVLADDNGAWKLRLPHTRGVAELTGSDAVTAAGLVLPRVTWRIASPDVVDGAIGRIQSAGGPDRVFDSIADQNRGRYGTIRGAEALVAAEISAHHSAEGEHLTEHLRHLEAQWREAEEIAAIADDLVVPEDVARRLDELRAGLDAPASSLDPP
jgi:hypothetical protein